MPQDTPSALSPGIVTTMAQEIDRLTHEMAKRDERIAELERERAGYADADALRHKVTQMMVWRHEHDLLLQLARQNGLQKMYPHEFFRRAASDFCSTRVGNDLSYYRDLTELHAHIEDECERAAEEHDNARAKAAAPQLRVEMPEASPDQLNIGSNNIRYK